jgi:mevalonate kinase
MSVSAAVSVPGKTILFGEHAAVYGHPALVAALDRRMTVTVTARASDRGVLRLDLPDIGVSRSLSCELAIEEAARARENWRRSFESDGTIPFHAAGADGLPVVAVVESAREAWLRVHDVAVSVRSDIPAGSGFGSSAALAVGLAAACRRASDAPASERELAEIAVRIERHQHGRPSGVDVEAVLKGGALWCRRTETGLSIEPLRGPDVRLTAFRLFDSGSPAESTGEMVAGVRRLRDHRPARVEDALAALDAAAVGGRDAIERGDDAALLPIVRRAEAALERLGVVHAGVCAAIRAIEAGGGAAKISGAGGRRGEGSGLVLVVHPDPAWHAGFRPPEGWTAHDVALGAAGLREEVAA